jgi:pimeloyl-ACP methyl ester carboxylesterase
MKIYLEADGESTELLTAISPFFLLFGFFTNADFGAYFANKADYVDRLQLDIRKQNLSVKLPSITKPVLVVTGKRDFIVPPIPSRIWADSTFYLQKTHQKTFICNASLTKPYLAKPFLQNN